MADGEEGAVLPTAAAATAAEGGLGSEGDNAGSASSKKKGIAVRRQDSTEELEQPSGPLETRMAKSASRRRRQQGNVAQRMWRALRGQEDPLPQANPKNWPKPTIDDLKERPLRVVQVNKNQQYAFCDNFIKTSKYEVWSFMPKFLAMEFHPRKKIANLYFLVVSFMQAIPAITSTFGYPILLLPLLFIVMIDLVFTIIEDASRHKADAIANASPAVVLDKATGKWAIKERWEVAVGDFVKVHNREVVPADMLVVGVHERYRPACSGVCYVETKSLDGETNLKIRQVQKVLIGRVDGHQDLESFAGRVIMEHPNKSIDSFTGTLEVSLRPGGGAFFSGAEADAGEGTEEQTPGVVREPITPDNLLLRDTVLRNTKWATGLVLSTGHDTKVMMSIAKAPEKSSHLNARINTEIKGLAAMLFTFCLVGGLGSAIWQSTHEVFREEVLQYDEELIVDFIIQFFYYLLLLYGFVPISLYVSQNFIRYFQAWFMDQDLDMYHAPTDTPSRVRTMNLNEDLGQITHVFSDKTGTLTQNVMDFRKCTIRGQSYGQGMTEIGQAALKIRGVQLSASEKRAETMAEKLGAPHVNFYDPTLFRDLEAEADAGDGEGPITDFMTLIALCHTVIPERPNNSDEIVLSASSPDDEALVLGAKYFGVEFAERVDTRAVLYRTRMPDPLAPSGEPVKETYDVLRILGFNSVRKRMSVVVRCPDGSVKVLAKGADTTMMPLLHKDTSQELLDTTMSQLEDFALEGLRTLMLGSKEMPEEEYAAWDEAYDEAINDLHEVTEQQAGRPNKIDELMAEAEQGLTLIGGTAIEDKLQNGVGETIEKMIRGGMVVWVITGDKEETAINIGVACRLLWSESRMDRVIINTKTCPTSAAVKERLLEEFERYSQDMAACSKDQRSCKPRCLVIDGAAFSLIEDAPLTSLHGPLEGEESLAELAMESPPVHERSRSAGLSFSVSERKRASASAPAQETPSRLRSWRGGGHEPGATHPRSRDDSLVEEHGDSGTEGGGHPRDRIATVEAAPVPPGGRGMESAEGEAALDEEKRSDAGDITAFAVLFKDESSRAVESSGGVAEKGGAFALEADEKRDDGTDAESPYLDAQGPAGAEEEEGGVLRKALDVDDVVVDPGDVLTAKEALLQFAGVCQAFVGCRMSPDQKRQLVHLIKDNNPRARTLAVGDGANDVPMIQAAHVGVGISGQEGLQAVNASDYALAQFSFLQKLLLCHGRFNYRRMSFASSYLFYKSVSWAVPLFLYAFWNGLSGQIFYDIYISTLWAIVFTGLPIIVLGIYDMDVLPATALRYPWLYRNGVDDELLTKSFFWGWIAQGVLESCWVTIPLMFLQTGGAVFHGETPAVQGFGQAAFMAMTLAVNMKILFIQKRWHWVEAVLLTVSTGLLFAMSWLLNAMSAFISIDWEWFGFQDALFKDPNYWAVMMFGVVGVLMRDVAWKAYHRWWNPKLHHVLVEMEKGRMDDIDLPINLRNSYSLDDVVQEDTSSRMTRARTQSMQRLESHKDAVRQALGASGSGSGRQDLPYSSGGTLSATQRHLNAVVAGDGRPRSAGGRLTSLTQLFEGISRSPITQADSRRGRSAGSSPVWGGDNRGYGTLLRRRSSCGDEEQQEAIGVARVGFAFSQDPRASAHEIGMIMKNRTPYNQCGLGRKASLPAPSRLPEVDGAFQAHLRALQAHHAVTRGESDATSEADMPRKHAPVAAAEVGNGKLAAPAPAGIARGNGNGERAVPKVVVPSTARSDRRDAAAGARGNGPAEKDDRVSGEDKNASRLATWVKVPGNPSLNFDVSAPEVAVFEQLPSTE